MENILFFIPFGELFPWKEKWIVAFFEALVLSVLMEIAQYIFALGWCEIDDVISNMLGAMLGYWVFIAIRKKCINCKGR